LSLRSQALGRTSILQVEPNTPDDGEQCANTVFRDRSARFPRIDISHMVDAQFCRQRERLEVLYATVA
jgi:hypothetical protein